MEQEVFESLKDYIDSMDIESRTTREGDTICIEFLSPAEKTEKDLLVALEPEEPEIEMVMKEHEELLKKVFPEESGDAKYFLHRLDSILEERQGRCFENFRSLSEEEFLNLVCLYSRLRVWDWLDAFDRPLKTVGMSLKLQYAHLIGYQRGFISGIESRGFYAEMLKKIGHRIKAAEAQIRRWSPSREQMERVAQEAEKLWQNGDTRMHNEMAKDLADPDKYPNLTPSMIRKSILPVALDYGKARGLKGHTKSSKPSKKK